ncbi:heme exporter protein CcmD [Polymorphobacter sp. PAMC 29334]|nr:heme exporter protein CcmD [Polymorphobacter sp. PAMC 29334]QYE36007.1 heme exporter protein CcmD [Polymorphobacter sp. PAMC 29334]
MNHAEFVYPSYALTIAGMVGVLAWSWLAMRRAEAAAAKAKRR